MRRAAALALASIGPAYGAWFVFTAPMMVRVQYLPDDAFYYLTLARHRVLSGIWTFDGGVSVTTGFHLLQGYVLALLYAVHPPAPEQFVREAVLLSSLALVPALVLAATFVARAGRLFPALLLLLFALSRNVLVNASSVMEWSWVVTASAAYGAAVLALRHRRTLAAAAWLFGCGLLGSLARSDFGLMPAAMCAAAAAVPGIPNDTRRHHVAGTAAGLAGALAGTGLIFIHNLAISGQALQSSASVKWNRLAVYRPSVLPILYEIERLFGRQWRTTWMLAAVVIVATCACGGAAFLTRRPSGGDALTHRVLWTGSGAAVIGYVAFYALNAGVQPWYTANLVVPLFMLLSIPALEARTGHPLMIVSTGALLVLLAGQLAQVASFATIAEYPAQPSMAEAGEYLRAHPVGGRVGAWNAGLVGYHQGGTVVNLDGLVNNDSAAFIAAGQLPAYVDAAHIEFVVDDALMLESSVVRRSGGYDDEAFLARLQPIRRFAPPGRETLYRVAPAGPPTRDASPAR